MPTKKMPTTQKKRLVKKPPTLTNIYQDLNEIFGLLRKNFENVWDHAAKKQIEQELKKGVKTINKKLEDVLAQAKQGETFMLKKMHETLQKTAQTLKKSAKQWKPKK